MTFFLTLDEAIFIQAELIKATGGADGIRDAGLVEAALLRPQTGYYSDLLEEASAMWESLAMHRGFIDGNKRIAYACLEIFLEANGYRITASNFEIEKFIYSNLEGSTFNKDVLDAWLRENTAAQDENS